MNIFHSGVGTIQKFHNKDGISTGIVALLHKTPLQALLPSTELLQTRTHYPKAPEAIHQEKFNSCSSHNSFPS